MRRSKRPVCVSPPSPLVVVDMARQQSAGAKAKAKARAEDKATAQSKGAKRKAEATTALDKMEAKETTAKKLKSTVDKKAELATQKAIRDNFKSMDSDTIDLTIRGGKSLRSRIFDDKKALLTGHRTAPMGKLYYTELKQMYASASSGASGLQVKNMDEQEEPKLVQALVQLFGKKKNLAPLQEWLQHADMCNQKSLVGLLRACATFNPRHSPTYNSLAIALLEWVVRHGAEQTFPEEVATMRTYWNGALVKVVADYKKHELTKSSFWENHRHLLHIIVPKEAAEKCFACTGMWTTVQSELSDVVASGELGKALFLSAFNEVAAHKVASMVIALARRMRDHPLSKAAL